MQVAEIDFKDWAAWMARWRARSAAVPPAPRVAPTQVPRLVAVSSNDRRRPGDRRSQAAGMPIGKVDRRNKQERRGLGVAEVSMDEWLSAIDLK
ncbi:MAG: hypothetical protein WBP72_10190 [Rhodocyclaceae bacterium]